MAVAVAVAVAALDRLLILAAGEGTCGESFEIQRKPQVEAQPPCPEFLGRTPGTDDSDEVSCRVHMDEQ